jgi:hypothetical protein
MLPSSMQGIHHIVAIMWHMCVQLLVSIAVTTTKYRSLPSSLKGCIALHILGWIPRPPQINQRLQRADAK